MKNSLAPTWRNIKFHISDGLPRWFRGKESATMQETQVQSLGREDPLEKGLATHSSILVWRIPWTEEPGGVHGVTKSQT